VQVKIESPLMKLDRTFPLQVQAPTPRQTVLKRFTVNPGETLEVKEAEAFGPAGFLKQTVNATLSVSDKAPIDVRSAVQGLLTYPYGCAEQTTSTAYPHVFIDEAAAKQFGLKPYTQAQRAEMLDKAIGRLAGMQAPNGGFSLWGNVNEYQYWLSAYITNFLLDAREQGFTCRRKWKRRPSTSCSRAAGGRRRPAARPVNYNENASGTTGATPAPAASACSPTAPTCWRGRARRRWPRCASSAEAQRAGALRPGLVHLGLALKLMGDEARSKSRHRRRPQEAAPQQLLVGRLRQQPARLGADVRAAAKARAQRRKGARTWSPGRRRDREEPLLSTQEKLALFLLGRSFANQQTGEWTVIVSLNC
jgi:uncharacterized protein YfaS (alpha-2-macroglobulin family)